MDVRSPPSHGRVEDIFKQLVYESNGKTMETRDNLDEAESVVRYVWSQFLQRRITKIS